MCIRDRYLDRFDGHVLQTDELPCLDRLQRKFRLIDLSQLCLLYTSDAADEQSSVDLGGRRIIKNKNSVRRTGRTETYR